MLEALGLTSYTETVYRAMLDHPALGVDELAVLAGLTPAQVHEALDQLADLLLIRVSRESPSHFRAVPAHIGLTEMIARQEAEIAARQARVAASRMAVARLVADHTAAKHPISSERLLGLDAIQSRLEEMGRAARSECVGVHPGSAQRPDDLSAGRPLDAEALRRGVAFRTLYQDSVRNDAATVEHARWLLDHGGEVRTAPVIPQRLVITDRARALVPIDPADTRKGAVYITEPGIVCALVELFDQAWAGAVPLGAARPQDPDTGLAPIERQLLHLLASGITDEAAGRQLGVSLRTVRRHMSSLMERLGASSRFEAGLKAAQRGWL
ncbi:helix-turn-helix transcriptional regulator [Streptomyces sp. NPDC003233]